ncbi:type II secretion system protein [Clostridium intestinale]|nr:type II secretion system protein [Clostridium intestinale]
MKKKKGFTLIEVIASIAMLVIIFSVISSLMLLTIKVNIRNEKDLDSNSVSKAFVELINSKKDADFKVNTPDNVYILVFDNIAELQNIFNNEFILGNSSIIKQENFDIATLDNSKKYAVKVKVIIKDLELGVLQFNITSWNLSKVNTSEISRTIYLAG